MAVRDALTKGAGMDGQPISLADLSAGMQRMAMDYGLPEVLERLEGVCGLFIARDFAVLNKSMFDLARTMG